MDISMDISYDPAKRAKALKERGIDFEGAGEVFEGRNATRSDDRRDYGEDRYITIGFLNGRPVVVVWTPRDGKRRIISMRYAHDHEAARYLG
jgi:hypothetical protein